MTPRISIHPSNTGPFLVLSIAEGPQQVHVFLTIAPQQLRELADQLEQAQAEQQVAA